MSATALALIGFSPAAHAACDPAAANDVTANCTGTTVDQGGGAPGTSADIIGYGTGFETNLTASVVSGASVTGSLIGIAAQSMTVTNSGTIAGSNFGIFAPAAATVTNSGSISGATGIAATVVTVTNSGTISGDTQDGISAITATVMNAGTISASLRGIIADTANVTNSGTISGDYGIAANTTATVTNSGNISGSTSGVFATTTANVVNSGTISASTYGVFATTANVTNTGTISAAAGAGVGAVTANVSNSGTIAGDSVGIAGILAANVTNTGTVSGGVYGIRSATTTVTNSGTITGNVGIDSTLFGGGIANVSNSGTIIGTGGTALQFSGNDDTLTLLPGSRILGAIDMGGGADVVNFIAGRDTSWLITLNNFTGTINGFGDAPFVIRGNQIATLDPTPFAMADRTLMDFTRSISGILGSLGGTGAAQNGPLASAFAPDDSIAQRVDAFASIPALAYAGDAILFKSPTVVTADGRSVWARGFAGEHTQQADGALLHSTTTFAGGAVGFDLLAQPDLRLGAFVGGGQSVLSLDVDAGNTRTDTGFGGLYGRYAFTSFGAPSTLEVALHGGSGTSAVSRTVNSNLGVEVATASYNSSYVSPEAKYSVNVPLWSQYTLTPSFGLRYVAGFFDGYTETGATAPLTVAARTIQNIEQRGEVKLTRATPVGPDLLLTNVYVGALGIERLGDTTVNTVLLGANLPFVTPGKNNVAGVLGGGGFEWRTRKGVSFFGAGEAIGMSDSGTVVSARGGLRVAF
ncbi:autotransporter domain-containing protein [Bradyrhizobium sp. CNPSo 4010]|uniref:Autotransporter domain-containing protein n=1 Tax=Bradyrhizobium agreste TaxID=2751811 RepID=A0ABS0PI09_9BRAD|nr:autotransporter outer membrane beta-barrel domain-containing protein [Bradyrhizobium agreste]MBH5396839.1 autotransporter domain-containing protein [Bradyrhizobium agreste]